MAAFEEMGVLPEISKAVEEMGWNLPTDVQAEAIPLILGGGDVLMAAETGSGKTGAFCLPIAQIVWETLRDEREPKKGHAHSAAVRPWVLSSKDRSENLAVTPDGLRCQSREQKVWQGSRATTGVYGSGRYYFEATVMDEGLCRVGWSTEAAKLDLGTDMYGFGFGGTGKKSNNSQFDNYGTAFGKNDIIGCWIDFDNLTIGFSKNGEDFGVAFKISGHIVKSSTFFPAVVLKNAEMSFNFGTSPLKHLKSGFTPASQAKSCRDNSNESGVVKLAKRQNHEPLALVLEPSRELAEQTKRQLELFTKKLASPSISTVLVVGGYSPKAQLDEINCGVDILVATPGRLEDFIMNGQVGLSHCRFFVLDEADGLLKQGQARNLDNMHTQIPKMTSDGRRLQMIVCSATLHDFDVKKLADRLMHFPTWVDLKGEDSVPDTVHHVVVKVDPKTDQSWQNSGPHITTDGVHYAKNNNEDEIWSERVKTLKGLYCVNAIESLKMNRAIIFCRTKLDCDNLENYLNLRGKKAPSDNLSKAPPFSCVCLHSDRNAEERNSNLQAFKDEKVRFLICTDVAARGIDIRGLPFMINMTLPDDKTNYVHRIGRVGRAERMGLAVSLVATCREKVWFHGQWCKKRGKNCYDTNKCCIWQDEMQYLGDIEDHLKLTIPQVDKEMNVPMNEFDGKVTYGEKRVNKGTGYKDHVAMMAPAVQELAYLERQAQIMFLNSHKVKAK
ncbi:ATP-dependent RNA helicase Ddx1 [Neocloeon triangulifer]|uniref:ATP-dependent RNA helicase Ddx1 n=1 Tax=Neocloeon triangulifer TaxID=2078957 RepID=UPI00286F72C5|nr:ATP-dependent RNA helicase Ddx1 [Neocloeon triangulifer]